MSSVVTEKVRVFFGRLDMQWGWLKNKSFDMVGIGPIIGVIVGVILDNVGLGVALGIIIGAVLSSSK